MLWLARAQGAHYGKVCMLLGELTCLAIWMKPVKLCQSVRQCTAATYSQCQLVMLLRLPCGTQVWHAFATMFSFLLAMFDYNVGGPEVVDCMAMFNSRGCMKCA